VCKPQGYRLKPQACAHLHDHHEDDGGDHHGSVNRNKKI
jgi:hypothetical protein